MAAKGKGCKGSDKVDRYRDLFKEFDKNNDGYLTGVEFRNLLNSGGCKMSDSQVADCFVFFDGPKGDKRLTFEEFTKGLDAIVSFIQELRQLFDRSDADGSGYLDKKELRKMLECSKKSFTEQEITDILRQADKNGDNQISWEEFKDACC